MTNNQLNLSYDNVTALLNHIITQLEPLAKPTLVVGVVRGGLIPSTILSHKLKVPMITTHVSLRDRSSLLDHEIDQLITACRDDNCNIMIVEDINDSGATLVELRKIVENANPKLVWGANVRTAVVVENTSSQFACDFVGMSIDKSVIDTWVNFPWEREI